jgi:hypothetical protein
MHHKNESDWFDGLSEKNHDITVFFKILLAEDQ